MELIYVDIKIYHVDFRNQSSYLTNSNDKYFQSKFVKLVTFILKLTVKPVFIGSDPTRNWTPEGELQKSQKRYEVSGFLCPIYFTSLLAKTIRATDEFSILV